MKSGSLKNFDILIVGAGLSGAVLAERFANLSNLKVLIIDKRDHIGGNCYDFIDENGILMNKYGAHLFHTNYEDVWEYIHKFAEWRRWDHKVIGSVEGKLINIPVNINTVNTLFGILPKSSLHTRIHQQNTYSNAKVVNFKQFNNIYVDRWESPCIRCLFEYGKLKTRKEGIYPDKFTFGKLFRHNIYDGKLSIEDFYKTQPKMNDYLDDYDLLITPELFRQGNNDKWTLINNTTNFFIQKDI